MNEIFITDASAVFAEKLTLDDTIIKGDKFYFGKLEQDFESIDNDRYDLRCNRVLKYLIDKLDLSGFRKDEIGIVIGTTNSGVEEFETTENKHHAELGNPAEFLKWYLGTTNYATCVSTACTSGAKAFSTARKLLENGVCKAVIVGGVDTLASMPSYGFHALEVLSHERTNPFSKNRDGISLGEGGALFVVVKAAEQLGSEAAKRDLDAKMPRGKEVKSVSEIKDDKTIRRKDDKYKTEAISRHCEITDEYSTWGTSNEIHICDSNMNDSYEREVISRCEALPSRKNPADTNLIQSQGIKINSTEADQASMHLGIFASNHQNDGIIHKVAILGIGETSDAYHSATPDPDGVQAVKAIQDALDDANLKPEDIDYINLHGTGTISNDLMEANAIYRVFGDKVPASSTKPLTGHCLGAAASIEAFICYQILKGERNLPIHKFDGEYDETLPKINLVTENTPQKEVKVCMSTSFGFGGTNAVVVLAARQLRSEAAKRDLDAKMPRGKEVKSVSEIKDDKTIRRKDDKYKTEAISRHCEITDEYSTWGTSNEIHICDSNMNDSYEREVISRCEALPSRKNPADTNLIQSQGIKINSTEADQASMHLGILASRHQNDVGIAMPTYKTTSNSNLAAQPPSCLAASCLPHSAPMVLIDEVLNVDMENQIVKTSVKIHDNKIFFNKEINGISPLVGIEFMAQTIGCYAYFKAGKTIPKIGFLLGTRQYENKLEKFENGKTYILTAREIYGDNELVSFECLIYNEGEDENSENYIAKATINAFQPKDAEKYIKELG